MKALAAKLAAVAAAIGEVPKSGYNQEHQYHYATEADLVVAVRQELFRAGVTFVPAITKYERIPVTDKSVLSIIHLLYRFVDSETGEEIHYDWISEAADTRDKGLAKAITNGLKYFLRDTFLIPTGDFEDEVDYAGKPTGKRRVKPAVVKGQGSPQPSPQAAESQRKRQVANEAVARAWTELASTLTDAGVEIVPREHPKHASMMAWILGLAPQVLGENVKRLSDLQPASIKMLAAGIARMITEKEVQPWKRAA